MRALALPLLLALAACGESAPVDRAEAGAAAAEDDRVDCLLRGTEQYNRFCTIERSAGPEGTILTLRKPDGGFRRLLVATDGRGVVAADGAEQARVSILDDDRIEVEIAGDRFRLPATVRQP